MASIPTLIRRNAGLLVLVAVLIAWPLMLRRIGDYPALDMETVREASAFQEGLISEIGGRPDYKALQALWPVEEERNEFLRHAAVWRLFEGMWRTTGEPWVTELGAVEAVFGEALDGWGSLDGKAAYAVPHEELIEAYETGEGVAYAELAQLSSGTHYLRRYYNFIRARSVWHLARSVRAMEREEWAAALDEIDRAMRVWKPFYATSPSGIQSYLSTAADGYAELLTFNPPAPVSRAAAERLHALLSELEALPELPISVVAANLPQTLTMGVPARGIGLPLTVTWNEESVRRALYYRDRFEDPWLMAWASRFEEPIAYDSAMRNALWWTSTPSEAKFLRLAAKRQPEILAAHRLPEELLERLDAATLAYTLPYDRSVLDPERRLQLTQQPTEVQLLEIAFAARAFRGAEGRWPRDLEELYPEYMQTMPEGIHATPGMSVGVDTRPWTVLPVRMGWLELSRAELKAHWDARLPDFNHLGSYNLERTPEQNVWEVCHVDWDDRPIRRVALKALLQRREKFLENVELTYRAGREEGTRAEPLTPEIARWAMDEDAAQPDPRLPSDISLPAEHRIKRRDQVGRMTPGKLRDVRLTMRTPASLRVFAIWSPGPDGIDDGGRMPYVNYRLQPGGSVRVHRGDIVVFPDGL